MTEYALLVAGIALVAAAGYNGLGNSTNGAVSAANQLIAGSTAAPGSGTNGSSGGSGGTSQSGSGSGTFGDGDHHHHDDRF